MGVEAATYIHQAIGLLWGPLGKRLLLALVAANPDILAEFQGIARPIGCSSRRRRSTPTLSPTGPPLKQVELALADRQDQQRRVAEALNGPISALVVRRFKGDRDREALHAAAEALRAWAATDLEHVTLPDVREALESFVALVPVDPATSLKPFLAAEWLPRIAALRQLVQLTEVELGRLAAWR